MIQAHIATTLDHSKFTVQPRNAALINSSAYYAEAPWKFTALIKLRELENTPTSQIQAEDLLISANATMFARTVLGAVQEENLPTPAVCQVTGGSVAMIWTVGLRQLEAIFGPDRFGSFVLSDGDQIVGDGEMSTDDTESFSSALGQVVGA